MFFLNQWISSPIASYLVVNTVNNNIEEPMALDVQLRGLYFEPNEAKFALVGILNGGKKDYRQH